MAGAYAALANRDFRVFLTVRVLVTLAMMIMSLAVSWQVFTLTKDPLALGLVGLTEAIPSILVSLWAGHIADKYSRGKIIIGCVLMLLLCAVILISTTYYLIHLPKSSVLTMIFSAVALSGVARGFYGPAYNAFLPQLVERHNLSNAISWNSGAWEVASVIGLSIGGLLYGFVGVTKTYWIMLGLLVVALAAFSFIPKKPAPEYTPGESAMLRIREGLRFVRGNPLLINALMLDMLAVLLGGAVALLPVFADEVLHIGSEGLGLLRAAVGLGAITMSLFIAHRKPGVYAGKVMLAAIAGFGVCTIGLGLSKTFWAAFFFLYVSGMLDGISVFIRAALVQHLTPDEMKGRVTSINKIFITSSNEIGAFESGLTARLLGTLPAILFGGFACIAIVIGFWIWAPSLRNLNFRKLEAESRA